MRVNLTPDEIATIENEAGPSYHEAMREYVEGR